MRKKVNGETTQLPLVIARNLSKSFNKVKVLKNLDIDFGEGERIALIGRNGAGKTTLIRCIMGQYIFDGSLKVLGKDPRKQHREIMRHIGFIPQSPPPIKMTVAELINFISQLTNTPQEEFLRISKSLNFQVEENLSKPFFKLSGGMKQKLLVSIALGRKPKMLFMDEPSANLDPEARLSFFKLLQDYGKDSLMVLSSHRMEEIETLVNRVVEMDLGEVVFDKSV